jgi:Asp-tRNA(Asn)/Glu-tRNA(Gln) amidotransferase B subunit
MPDQKIERYKTYKLSDYDSKLLAEDPKFSYAYDISINASPSLSPSPSPSPSPEAPPEPDFAKGTANLFLGPIKTLLNESNEEIDINKINPEHFQNLFDSVSKSEISSTVAKQVIVESYKTGKHPIEIAKDMGLIQVSDTGEIEKLGKEVIANNQKAVEDYKKNPASIGFLIGQLMKASNGSANPQLAKEILEKLLK